MQTDHTKIVLLFVRDIVVLNVGGIIGASVVVIDEWSQMSRF